MELSSICYVEASSKVASQKWHLFVQLSTSVSRVVAISDRCVVDVRVCRSIQGVGSTFV